jgi:hypothetical protein
VKKYIKSVFGASSAEYAQVKSIEFKKVKNKVTAFYITATTFYIILTATINNVTALTNIITAV